jgi:hypothetical protein
MNQCDKCQILIGCYLDGESTEKQNREAFLHLAGCNECQSCLRTLLSMKMETARAKRVNAPTSLDKRIRSIAAESLLLPRLSNLWKGFVHGRIPLPVPVAVAVVICLVAIGAFVSRPQQTKVARVDSHTPRTHVLVSMPTISITQE